MEMKIEETSYLLIEEKMKFSKTFYETKGCENDSIPVRRKMQQKVVFLNFSHWFQGHFLFTVFFPFRFICENTNDHFGYK